MRLHKLLLGVLVVGLVYSCHAQEAEDDDFGEVEDAEEVDEAMLKTEEATEEPMETKEEVPKPVYKHPEVIGNAFFTEAFFHPQIPTKWVQSEAKKEGTDEDIAKYDGKWSVEEPAENPMDGDLGLVLKSRAHHHAISAPLDRPYDFAGNPLVVQYEVKYQNGMDCGGSYVKLLRQDDSLDLKKLVDKTPFTIMFGPDKCGTDSKIHFIFQHKNPKTGEYEEKHAKPPTKKINEMFDDKKTHLFTLVVKPNNKFEVYIDQNLINSGSLLDDFSPAVNPPAEIEDPDDKKPEDWDEKEKIADAEATKPEDWDETQPEMIPDESAVKPEGWLDDELELIPDPESERPEDWDDEMDGEWEPAKITNPKCESAPGCGEWTRPNIRNPLYKGKWKAPMIANPNYKGIWKPKIIANPSFFEDKNPYKMTPIVAVGLELWSMSDDILFDNFIITDDKNVADNWAEKTWVMKNRYEQAKAAASGEGGFINTLLSAASERPWLWAVYLVVILLPIVAISIFLCPSKPQETQDDDDDAAARKKTDEASPDDVDEDVVEEDASAPSGSGDGPEDEGAKKSGKSALDAEEDENEDNAENEEVDEGDAENEEEGEEEKVTRRSSPRKRKPRKD